MLKTEKLYYQNSYQINFSAEVILTEKINSDKFRTLLDKTYFYPTSGGQPYDTGFLEGVHIFLVEEEDGLIWHYSREEIKKGRVKGEINFPRRLEHIQHHTGQHLLSQALIRILGYPTVSFHLGSSFATIEIDARELSDLEIKKVEELANQVIYENRLVKTHYFSESELKDYHLRKQPKKKCNSGEIRVIEIADFDLSPCGGTHARSTGELGLIKIIGKEKHKGKIKLDFLCGKRALTDYQLKNELVRKISANFSTSAEKLGNVFSIHLEEEKKKNKLINQLKKDFSVHQAKDFLAHSVQYKDFRLVKGIIVDYEPEILKKIAQTLIEAEKTISLLALIHEGNTHLVFCRSNFPEVDLKPFFQKTIQKISGKGGGKSDFLQGSGEKTNLKELLDFAEKEITSFLTIQPKEKGNKLHLGCGDIYLDGFLNIDLDPNSKADILMDITDLKFSPESCTKIVAHSCFEHLTYEEAALFLQECYRVLEPGGILDIEVPDIDEYAKKWANLPYQEKWAFHNYIVFWGGQWTPHQLHKSGWGAEFLGNNLAINGFKNFQSLPPLHPMKHYHMIRIVAEKALLSVEEEAKLSFFRGVEKLKRLNGQGAIIDFQKSINLEPNLTDNYPHLMLTAISGFSSYEYLLDYFQKVLLENPESYGPNLGIALIKSRQGDFLNAKRLYADLTKIIPAENYALQVLKKNLQSVGVI